MDEPIVFVRLLGSKIGDKDWPLRLMEGFHRDGNLFIVSTFLLLLGLFGHLFLFLGQMAKGIANLASNGKIVGRHPTFSTAVLATAAAISGGCGLEKACATFRLHIINHVTIDLHAFDLGLGTLVLVQTALDLLQEARVAGMLGRDFSRAVIIIIAAAATTTTSTTEHGQVVWLHSSDMKVGILGGFRGGDFQVVSVCRFVSVCCYSSFRLLV